MNRFTTETSDLFNALVNEIPHIGFKHHASSLLALVTANNPFIKKSIKDLPSPQGLKARSGIIISAGPSVRRKESIKRIHKANYGGTVIATDGSYIACLKMGIVPDYVISLDPHPTRMVRWFGDPDFEKNSKDDDYFARQDLDVEFRKNNITHNKENIELVNQYAPLTRAIVATTIADNLRKRLMEAKFDLYWWNPLVDSPRKTESLTRKIHELNNLPCMNTGGTVGTAAWVFAATRLKINEIALVGMDFGYYNDTPIHMTQTYYELLNRLGSKEDSIEKCFRHYTFPLTGEKFYIDPTYFWYRQNFLELFKNFPAARTFNCTEGGTLIHEEIDNIYLEDFFKRTQIK